MNTQIAEIPVAEEDLEINAERKTVQLSATKFQDLVEYVDHLESALKLSELDVERDHHQVNLLLGALKAAYALLSEIANYYGGGDRGRYYDLRARWTREVRFQASQGNISDRQCEQISDALADSAAQTNGVAEGGVGG